MSYLVFCTFDLKNATSQDYQNAYADLVKIGLKKVITASQGHQVVIPTTAAMGELDGGNAKEIAELVRSQIRTLFSARGFESEIFLTVGAHWYWASGTTL